MTNHGTLPQAEAKAAQALSEELTARTGSSWPVTTEWPESGPVIAITSRRGNTAPEWPAIGPEGYRLFVQQSVKSSPIVWVIGAEPRGALYGVGKLLRCLDWGNGGASLPELGDVVSAPAIPLRGHQIGYRNTANSYDKWTVARYDQYIRELVFFGANAIENIPFDTSNSPHFPISKSQMARELSPIC